MKEIKIQQVKPGPFPFENDEFDIVFSKDSIVHVHDKEKLSEEVFRILKPGVYLLPPIGLPRMTESLLRI